MNTQQQKQHYNVPVPALMTTFGDAKLEQQKQTHHNSDNSISARSSSSNWSDRLHSVVGRFYRKWAHFVVAHPIKIIIFCFLLTGICAVNMAKTKHKNNIRGYTPYGSRSLYEFDVRDEFFGQSGVGIRFFLLVLPKNGTNMLDTDVLRETVEVDSIVQNNLTIFNRVDQRDEPFSQICRRFCTINEPVNLFYIGWKDQQELAAKKKPANDRVQLDYPISTIIGREVNIQPNFFGVHFANNNNQSHGRGRSFTNMESAEMIVLLYRAERIGGWSDEDISQYELSVSDYFKNHYQGQHTRVLTISTSYAQVEVDRSGNILRSHVGLGLVVMIVCSLLTTSFSAFLMRQFSLYKLPVALFACLCPFMASGTALGLIFFFGVRNASILGLTPFLILAIGVDDAFLTIHSWQLASIRRRNSRAVQKFGSIDAAVADQLAEVLEDTGPAILISALTNILADIVGLFTGSPEITLLCIGNIASIIVDFFYQITLFTAILVICARYEFRAEEAKKQNKIAPVQEEEEGKTKMAVTNSSSPPPLSSSSSQDDIKRAGVRTKLEAGFNSFTSLYVRFVSNLFTSIVICAFWVAFLLVCLNAMLKFEINLTTKKLFPPDSPLLEIENYREDKVLPLYTTAQLFINSPGDLSNNTRRHQLNQLIEEMEHLPYAYPAESSFYFVRTYEAFEKFMSEADYDADAQEELLLNSGGDNNEESGNLTETDQANGLRKVPEKFDLSDLETFLDWPEYRHWRGLLNFHTENDTEKGEQRVVLDSFMATVAYHGEDLKNWYNRALMLTTWRRVVDKYQDEFNVSVLHDDGLYLDLLENMPTDIWQSALATLVCMALICAVFMNNFFVVVVTTCVIASIFVETLGLMSLMGMSIDPVVMAAIVISIGFSVDIPAHVSYHFHTAKWTQDKKGRKTPRCVEERVQRAFDSVGFPALQSSICTNICIMVLLVVPLYLSQVFVRVLCTCLTLTCIHSLVLLPALFTLVASIDQLLQDTTAQNDEEESTPRRRTSVRI